LNPGGYFVTDFRLFISNYRNLDENRTKRVCVYACDIIQAWLVFSSRQFKEIKEFKEFKENEEAETSAQTGARHSN
jgi:hypothetical protein